MRYDSAYPHNLSGGRRWDRQIARLTELTGVPFAKLASHYANPGPQVSFDRPALSPCLSVFADGTILAMWRRCGLSRRGRRCSNRGRGRIWRLCRMGDGSIATGEVRKPAGGRGSEQGGCSSWFEGVRRAVRAIAVAGCPGVWYDPGCGSQGRRFVSVRGGRRKR